MSFRYPVFFSIAVSLILIVSACAPAATEMPRRSVEVVTPTPEVFRPVDPSPTASGSALPLTCQITDLNVYINEEWGYCFAYPMQYTPDESRAGEGIISLYGPALDEYADPIRVSLEVTTQPVPEESNLALLVDAYLTQFRNVPMPISITREPWLLGSVSAEKIEPVPGLLSSRVVMALHGNILFTLRFHPSDIEYAKSDLDALTQTVSGSFAFLDDTVPPVSRQQTITWFEFGKNISLSYDPSLAPWVEARTVPAVPLNDQILFAEAHPAFAQIRFLGFQGGREYQLPILPAENHGAQVMVFPTAEFPGYGDDSPQGFVSQLQALKNLLETGVDPSLCTQPVPGDPPLPYLPWINAMQSFCAQPQIIEFAGGRGIRYLTRYTQGLGPVQDQEVFYTFQGLTDDGQYYVSALFPVQTGIFPTEAVPCPKCGDPDYDPRPEWQAILTDQFSQLNSQPADDFKPSLAVLDQLVQSIRIGQ